MKIEVSNGEIIDKLTILQIKLEMITDPLKIANIQYEYDTLLPIASKILKPDHLLVTDLKSINSKLWKIEDDIREMERNSDFGPGFIELARQVYRLNDKRAGIKREINKLTNSGLIEEKSYSEF